MNISSRTPEGLPNRCPICGRRVILEPSDPTGDAPCPDCGHLLWWFQQRSGGESGAARQVSLDSSFVDDLGSDSLDLVEWVMELEEEFDIDIPDEDAARITTVGQAIQYIEARKRGGGLGGSLVLPESPMVEASHPARRGIPWLLILAAVVIGLLLFALLSGRSLTTSFKATNRPIEEGTWIGYDGQALLKKLGNPTHVYNRYEPVGLDAPARIPAPCKTWRYEHEDGLLYIWLENSSGPFRCLDSLWFDKGVQF